MYRRVVEVTVAAKYRNEPATVKYEGVLLALPAAISCTRDTAEPVNLNNSAPFVAVVPWKYIVEPNTTRYDGFELAEPGFRFAMSLHSMHKH